MLRYGIPPYRLPRDVLDRDIEAILGEGVELKCGMALGRDIEIEDLLERHTAVFLGIGAWIGSLLGVAGDELEGVTDCLTFLGSGLGNEPPVLEGKKIVVVGGGDAAIDCARVSRRLGSEDVTIVYRRGRDQMPGAAEEIERSLVEGIALETWVRPFEILSDDSGKARALIGLRTNPGPIGADGRVSAVDVPGSELEIPADLVISAVGQKLDHSSLGSLAAELSQGGHVSVDPGTCATGIPRVYAGGDAATGPRTVVEALTAGKRAAWAIDCDLEGGSNALPSPVPPPDRPPPEPVKGSCRSCVESRVELETTEPASSSQCFEEVTWAISREEAAVEALRCMGCAPCAACDVCTSLLGCPAISRGSDGRPIIDDALCNGCGLCAAFCPAGAIVRVEP